MRQPEEILMEFLEPVREHKLFAGDRKQFAIKGIAFVVFVFFMYIAVVTTHWIDIIKIIFLALFSFIFIIFLFHVLDYLDEFVEEESVLGIFKVITILLLIAAFSVLLGF